MMEAHFNTDAASTEPTSLPALFIEG